MKGLVYPYEMLGETLSLSIQEASLVVREGGVEKDESLDASIDKAARTINLWQTGDKKWHSVRITVLLSGTRDDLEPFFQSSGVLTAVGTASCRLTNLRKACTLRRSQTNLYAWEGVIEIYRQEISGIVKLKATAVGKAAGRDCRYIADAPEWTIYVDSAYMPQISGALPVRWVDFGTDRTYGDLRKFSGEPYYLNLELPIPEVYLNKGFAGLPELFSEQTRPTGGRLALHETFRSSIAKSVWMALFQTALDAVVIGDEGEEPSLPDEEWQVSVIQQILPKLYSGYSLSSALQRVIQDKKAGDMRYVESTASAVIGRDIAREGKAVRTAVKSLEQELGGDL